MRIPSGKTDQSIYFVAVDATDLRTREPGLSSFSVFRSRNGAAEVAYTTPTVTEIDATNMPGVYALLLDEDTTIAAGSDSEEYCVHISHAAMASVTRTVELYRRDTTSGGTLNLSDIATIMAQAALIPGTQDGKTFAELTLLMAAALLGKASGLETNTAVFRAVNDSKDRITATVDEFGNRSAVNLDAA